MSNKGEGINDISVQRLYCFNVISHCFYAWSLIDIIIKLAVLTAALRAAYLQNIKEEATSLGRVISLKFNGPTLTAMERV